MTNSGEDVIRSVVIGRSVMDLVPVSLRYFYLLAYENVRRAGLDWWHIFECSSSLVSRHFHMRIMPAGCEKSSSLIR